ncbi:TIGR03546 family protein [Planctomycetes bacterium K23_9]|uniref:DUF2062 domain-containing protein n=1 Tax=Stieleria marina TaxID=1930275 RepID=A0A517NZC6_9BACT|nr:hypothetical protein K239x_44850 [Planctomycetes bacterium K23_9]
MIIWTIKLYKSIKSAIAGRRYPHQLAAAVAFGTLLGVVPHGNLLALAILIVVLSLRVNHAMAGITAIGVSFAASRMDPYSHVVGNQLLNHSRFSEYATQAWQLPIVPWTDLNNSVVMGSFVIGVAALIPIFMVTYPIFRLFKTTEEEDTLAADLQTEKQNRNVAKHSVVLVDQGHNEVAAPHVDRHTPDVEETIDVTDEQPALNEIRIDEAESLHETVAETHADLQVETRVDVIRMVDYRDEAIDDQSDTTAESDPAPPASSTPPPSDEALSYLLRQLRDSQQQRKAA